MAWVEKNTSQMPSVVVGRSATVIPRKALPTLKIRPKTEILPLSPTRRTRSPGAYSKIGGVSGNGRWLTLYLLAGVTRPRASWGRSKL